MYIENVYIALNENVYILGCAHNFSRIKQDWIRSGRQETPYPEEGQNRPE